MRVMFTSTPFGSHTLPMLPLAHALRAAGHEVIVVGQPDVADTAKAAGLCAAPIGDRFHGEDAVRLTLTDGKRPLQVAGPPSDGPPQVGLWFIHAGYYLTRYLEFARAWRPDLIVSEQVELAGCIIAGVLGVPSVLHRWGVDPLSGPARQIAGSLMHTTCVRLGLDGLPEPTAVLDPCPPPLQVPGIPAGLPIRPVPFNGVGQVPGWRTERRADRRICVSLGGSTLSLNGVPLLRSIVDACGQVDDTEVLVTVAPEFTEELGPVPKSVRVVPPTPLNLFLDTCDAVVHHGGAGSTLTSLYYGLPQLVLPQLPYLHIAAERIAATEAGISVPLAEEQDDPAAVHAALTRLLEDPRHTKAAAGLRDTIAAMPTPAAVVRDLVALAGG
ncbi:glycosyltransferase [Amycolatopsis xylanica]|uniref:Glycosyltransferase n=1 Tax=Amycolatopsis xylanica TaxID=589385 RepID=A0A1H2VNK9_9PSEU|nr:nucleotide disphospho-sugar-binding domain-containing protein [Amycolatopsis xylanica]SDW69887.1 glycosyltransferase [Amycolatopsis xylanica]